LPRIIEERYTSKQEDSSLNLVSIGETEPSAKTKLIWRIKDYLSNWLGVIGIVGFFVSWELATRFEILNLLLSALQLHHRQRHRAIRQRHHLGAYVV
jgi:hypothetical protein